MYFNELAEDQLYGNYSNVLNLPQRTFLSEFIVTQSDIEIFQVLKRKAIDDKFKSKGQLTESEMLSKLNFALGEPGSALEQSFDLLRANLRIRTLEKELAAIKANDTHAWRADAFNSLQSELSKVTQELEKSKLEVQVVWSLLQQLSCKSEKEISELNQKLAKINEDA